MKRPEFKPGFSDLIPDLKINSRIDLLIHG